MDTLVKSGAEFLVNTNAEGDQHNQGIAALTGGGFVVTWSDFSSNPEDPNGAVRGQVLAADGTKLGDEFLVNTSTFGNQGLPIVTGLDNGGFVVAWTDIAFGDLNVRAQLFDANGVKVGSEFVVNSFFGGFQFNPTLTALSGGGFVAAWVDSVGDGSGYCVAAKIFDDDGNEVSSQFLVNSNTSFNQQHPTIAALSSGGFVAAWTDQSDSTARAQIFDASGNRIGGELLVSSASNQDGPIVVGLANDSFVVLWKQLEPGFTSMSGQVFNADGTTSGASFLVSTTVGSDAGTPRGDVIGTLPDGRFVVTWADSSMTLGDASGEAVHAQIFNPDGTKSGDEVLVNTTVDQGQTWPSLTVLADGNVVIAWSDISQTGGDTSGFAIRAQIFSTRVPGLVLTGSATSDTLTGGAGDDIITGLGRDDVLTGGAGVDTFAYTGVWESKSRAYDTVTDFDAASDKLDLWYQVTGVDTPVVSGSLGFSHFDSNLASAVNASKLGAFHAVLFTPDSGSFAGDTFLIVDANGVAGYQAHVDLVILLGASSSPAGLDVTDFV